MECEKDRLSILNKYIFVDNNDIDSKFGRIDKDNRFEKKINKYLKNEIIEDIQFYNEEIFSKLSNFFFFSRRRVSSSSSSPADSISFI